MFKLISMFDSWFGPYFSFVCD